LLTDTETVMYQVQLAHEADRSTVAILGVRTLTCSLNGLPN
jgi:hypothetical protein